MKKPILCLALLCALLLPACGAGRAYNKNTQSWIGAPVKEMIAKWGEPFSTREGENGDREFIWYLNSTAPVWNEPQVYAPPAQYSDEDDFEYFKRRAEYDHNYRPDGYYSQITCRTTVDVDSRGRVLEVTPESFLGIISDCGLLEPPPAR